MTSGVTEPLAGVGEDGEHLYTCPLCEAMCGLEIQVSDGRIASIRGNKDDTWSHGHICPKGATLGAVGSGPGLAGHLLLHGLSYPSVARDVAGPRGAGGVDLSEGVGGQAQVDAVEAADGGGFRIGIHGATLAPAWRHVERCFLFCSAT